MERQPKISIIIPCLNEEKAIGICLDHILSVIKTNNFDSEIIVVDNGSNDQSVNIIKMYSEENSIIKLVYENKRGYGSAYLRGLKESTGDFILMADGDNTYDFGEIPIFIKELKKEGVDFVIGNRFIKDNSLHKNMPFLNRWVGNPALSFIAKTFFKIKINDFHCGIRAIRKESLSKLKLKTTGMEFASEMIVEASKRNLNIVEIPVNYNERIGESKLNPFVDGWRHLRFLFLYSPLYLFFIPGMFLFLNGLFFMFLIYFFSIPFFSIDFYLHPIFVFSLMLIVGYQIIFFGIFSKIYSITHLDEKNIKIEKMFKYITIERAAPVAVLVILFGLGIFTSVLYRWVSNDFSELSEIKNSVVALTFIVLGIQTFFSSFMLSILSIKNNV